MSLKYGLNIRKKEAAAPARRTLLLDDDDDEENDASIDAVEEAEITTFGQSTAAPLPPSRQKPGLTTKSGPPPSRQRKDENESKQDLSSLNADQDRVKAAEAVDPSIFDYDSFHDAKSTVSEAKKEAARKDAVERKPKYIGNLLDAAARRKQDQLIAREKFLQKEREAEGDEFADKEKFVTGAYKQQQEEARRLEEEEKKKAEEEEEKRRRGGGMQNFYRNMMDESDRHHQEAVAAAAKLEQEGGKKVEAETEKKKSDAELAAELKAKGVKVHVNDEGQITDKRQLLSAGLNVVPSGRTGDGKSGADHLKSSNRSAQSAFPARNNNASHQASRERQSRMMEEQLAVQAKRAREEEDEERARLEKAARSTKTEKDVSDAKARYLARKAAKERGEG